MPVTLDPTSWLLGGALGMAPVFARALGMAWSAPGVGLRALGWRIRLGLALMLTILIAPVIGSPGRPATIWVDPVEANAIAAARMILAELATGVLIGLMMGLVLAAARLAGEVVSAQAGLSVAGLLVPDGSAGGDAEVDHGGLSPLGRLYGLLALGVFLAVDGPLRLVGSLVESYQAVPIGGLAITEATVEALFGRVGWALGLAIRAAAPVALALALAGLAIGLLARATAGLQVLTLSIPVRIVLGVALAMTGLAGLVVVFGTAWDDVLQIAF